MKTSLPSLAENRRDTAKAGAGLTALAFVMWGLLPIYWKALSHVRPTEVLAHRIVWSLAVLAALLTVRRRWKDVILGVRTWRDAGRLLCGSLLLGGNWYAFVWAITNNRVLECSLGYYINPLLSMLLGCVFLGERLRRWQVAALMLAVAAVMNLLVAHGQLPWIGLGLAGTFSLYGLLRKVSDLGSLPGVTAETALLAVPAVTGLLYLNSTGQCALLEMGWQTAGLLIAAGLVTATPLLCFSYGARRIRLSTVGFLQYLAPSCMFLLGVLVYKEPFDWGKALTFAMLWVAIGLYSWDSAKNISQNRHSQCAQ